MTQKQFSDDCVNESLTRPDRPHEMAPTKNNTKLGYCRAHKVLGCERCKDDQKPSL
jgi:hypothetical protein